MTSRIVSRETIARQAAGAARYAQAHPDEAAPPNPYCPTTEPDHFNEWHASFTREVHALLAEEGSEGSA